ILVLAKTTLNALSLASPLRNKALVSVFLLFSAASVMLIWAPRYLPMVDLPQHLAQVAIVKNINNPVFDFHGKYFLDWFTPYLLGTTSAIAFSFVFSPLTAIKIVLTICVLGFPISLAFLLRKTRGDIWWSLIGFPMAFGSNFLFGHLTYMAAFVLGIF